MSTALVCLQDRLPSGATRRVQPMQLQEVVPSVYCRVSYSRLGLESEAKLHTRVICLVTFGQGSVLGFQPGKAGNEDD